MLYDEKNDNFQKFISEWDINKEYVLFGASKECVQFIKSIDYLMGDSTLKIKYIIDHNIKDNIVIDSVNEISEYYRNSNNIKNNRKNIKLISINNFKEFQDQIIITTDEFRNQYKKYLENNNVKYTSYKNIAAIWPFKYKNKVHIFQLDVLVTEKCNLNCSHCNMFMPHYDSPNHIKNDNIIKDIDLFFLKVDFVSILHLVGGEPFLYFNIDDIINHVIKNYAKKIDKFIITTNGTVTPRESTISLLKNNNIILSISDYSDKLEKIKNKVNKNIEIYTNHSINHYVRKEIKWYDFGDLRVKKNLSKKELINHFDSCTAPFRGLSEGKFYYCHLNTSAVRTKLFPSNNNDFVELSSVSSEDLLKFDLGYTNLGYITFCDNCNGCNTGIKIPVSYERQGVRNL